MKYLLVAIDVLSKYAWVSPMKDKTGKSLIAAFNSILKNGRKPEKLRTDKGTECVNVSFQNYLKKEGIDFYVATNEPKAAVVERLNCTLKSKLYRYFTSENTLHYIDDLQDIVDTYNNTYHWTIARTPASVNLLNVGSVRRKLYGKMKPRHSKKYKFNVGGFVRLSLRTICLRRGTKLILLRKYLR